MTPRTTIAVVAHLVVGIALIALEFVLPIGSTGQDVLVSLGSAVIAAGMIRLVVAFAGTGYPERWEPMPVRVAVAIVAAAAVLIVLGYPLGWDTGVGWVVRNIGFGLIAGTGALPLPGERSSEQPD